MNKLKLILYTVMMALSVYVARSESIVSFGATHLVSHVSMKLDSIVIYNVVMNKTYKLVDEYKLDLAVFSSVDKNSNRSNLILSNKGNELLLGTNLLGNYYKIISLDGTVICTNLLSKQSIDISNLARGVYFLSVFDGANWHTEKFNTESVSAESIAPILSPNDKYCFYAYRRGFKTDTLCKTSVGNGTYINFLMLPTAEVYYDSISVEIKGWKLKGSLEHIWTQSGQSNQNYTTEVKDYDLSTVIYNSEIRELKTDCLSKIFTHLEKTPVYIADDIYFDVADSIYMVDMACSSDGWTSTFGSRSTLIYFNPGKDTISELRLMIDYGRNEQSGTQPPYSKSINSLYLILYKLPISETATFYEVNIKGKAILDFIKGFSADHYRAFTDYMYPYDYHKYMYDYFKIEEVSDFAEFKIRIFKK